MSDRYNGRRNGTRSLAKYATAESSVRTYRSRRPLKVFPLEESRKMLTEGVCSRIKVMKTNKTPSVMPLQEQEMDTITLGMLKAHNDSLAKSIRDKIESLRHNAKAADGAARVAGDWVQWRLRTEKRRSQDLSMFLLRWDWVLNRPVPTQGQPQPTA